MKIFAEVSQAADIMEEKEIPADDVSSWMPSCS